MRRALAIATTLLVAGIFVPVAGASDPDTSGTPLVDGEPECGTEAGAAPADDGVLKIATYNLLHSQSVIDDETLEARLDLAADAVAASGADVVGAQEVVKNGDEVDSEKDPFPQNHGHVAKRLARELAERTGDSWNWCWFQSNPHFPGEPDVQSGGGGPLTEAMVEGGKDFLRGEFRIGEAIITRLPIEAARARRLPPRSYEAALCTEVPPDPFNCNLAAFFDSRVLLWGRLDAGSLGEFDMFTTHIAHQLTDVSSTTKRIQINAALQYIEEWRDPQTPDFFVGDFNSTPDTDRFGDVLAAGFTDTYGDAVSQGLAVECGQHNNETQQWQGCTSNQEIITEGNPPTLTVSRRIDHVFARGGTGCALSVDGSEIFGTNTEKFDPPDDKRWLWPSDHLGVVSEVSCTS